MINKILVGLLFCCLLSHDALSQRFLKFAKDKKLTVSGGLGMASYFGDLNNPGDYFDDKLNLAFGAEYYIANRLSVRGDLIYYRIAGDDAFADPASSRGVRNLHFRSDNAELSVSFVLSLFEMNPRRYTLRQPVNPFIFGGIGITYFNPKAELDGTWHALRPLQTERVAYGPIAGIFPIGAGVRVRATKDLNIVFEGGYRFTTTDRLDDVSRRDYPDPSEFSDPQGIAARLSRRGDAGVRGNPNDNDGYFLLNVRAEYYLPNFKEEWKIRRKLFNRKRPKRR